MNVVYHRKNGYPIPRDSHRGHSPDAPPFYSLHTPTFIPDLKESKESWAELCWGLKLYGNWKLMNGFNATHNAILFVELFPWPHPLLQNVRGTNIASFSYSHYSCTDSMDQKNICFTFIVFSLIYPHFFFTHLNLDTVTVM